MERKKSGPARRPLVDRFWEKVTRRGDNECWEWTGGTAPGGYGVIGIGGHITRQVRATRLSWEIAHNRPFPDGLYCCHTCDNPRCVNPSHLVAWTQKENIADMHRKGRAASVDQTRHTGELNGRALLTDNDVVEIVRLINSRTIRQKDIASMYGVCVGVIEKIKSGKLWSSITRIGNGQDVATGDEQPRTEIEVG